MINNRVHNNERVHWDLKKEPPPNAKRVRDVRDSGDVRNARNAKVSKPRPPAYSQGFVVDSKEQISIPLTSLAIPMNASTVLQRMHTSLSDQQSMKNLMNRDKHVYSAVAMILRPRGDSMDMLLVKRAQSEMDVFSGETCLPGGLYQKTDRSLFQTVEREVKEELGMDVRKCCRFIGQIPSTEGMKVRMGKWHVGVAIYIFEFLKGDITPDRNEVIAAAWVDCSVFWRKKQEMMKRLIVPVSTITSDQLLKEAAQRYNLQIEAPNVVFSAVSVVKGSEAGEFQWMIWGLTLQLVSTAFQIGASLPPLFPYFAGSNDPVLNGIIQYNWEFSKAFLEAAWNAKEEASAKIICDAIIRTVLQHKNADQIQCKY